MNAKDNPVYEEKITSRRTEALFVSLTILFLLLLVWHLNTAGMEILSIILFFFCGLFLFYSLNYRALIIRLTPELVETNLRPLYPDRPCGGHRIMQS